MSRLLAGVLMVHFLLQLVLPFRYVLYPGDVFWTEQGIPVFLAGNAYGKGRLYSVSSS